MYVPVTGKMHLFTGKKLRQNADNRYKLSVLGRDIHNRISVILTSENNLFGYTVKIFNPLCHTLCLTPAVSFKNESQFRFPLL